MIVYVVMSGEKHEGGKVISIHQNCDDAINAAGQIEAVFHGGWMKEKSPWNYYAENGCDFVSVQSFDVE
jgi:hypothetical protein